MIGLFALVFAVAFLTGLAIGGNGYRRMRQRAIESRRLVEEAVHLSHNIDGDAAPSAWLDWHERAGGYLATAQQGGGT